MTNVTDGPRSIAIAAAQQLKVIIALTEHDTFLQQVMRSANLVVQRSGMLVANQAKHGASQNHSLASLTIH